MSTTFNIPNNKNFLAQPNFRFFLKKTPHLNFFCQRIDLPGISIPPTDHPTPFVKIPYSGDHIDFEPLQLTFMVDEDLGNYIELQQWLYGLGFPISHEQYRELARKKKETGDGLVSDASLMILTSKGNPMFEVTFVDAFPINLSGLTFDSTTPDYSFLTASTTFVYTYYTINRI